MSKKRSKYRWDRIALLAGIICLLVGVVFLIFKNVFAQSPENKTASASSSEQSVSESTSIVSESRQKEEEPLPDPHEIQLTAIQQAVPGDVVDVDALDPGELAQFFTDSPLSPDVAAQIDGTLYASGFPDYTTDDLRDIRVLYHDFQGQTKVGQILAHRLITQDLKEIFQELYSYGYAFENVNPSFEAPVDEDSMNLDHTRCLYTYFELGAPYTSAHSYGLAIDINPLYNPQVISDENGIQQVLPSTAWQYADRTQENPYYIHYNDPIVQIFANHGFSWGGYWEGREDYQHFEKGFDNANRVIDYSMFQ